MTEYTRPYYPEREAILRVVLFMCLSLCPRQKTIFRHDQPETNPTRVLLEKQLSRQPEGDETFSLSFLLHARSKECITFAVSTYHVKLTKTPSSHSMLAYCSHASSTRPQLCSAVAADKDDGPACCPYLLSLHHVRPDKPTLRSGSAAGLVGASWWGSAL